MHICIAHGEGLGGRRQCGVGPWEKEKKKKKKTKETSVIPTIKITLKKKFIQKKNQ